MTISRCVRRLLLAAAIAVFLSGGTAARAGTDRASEVAALRKMEDVAHVKVADEIRRVALYCALKSDFDGARRDYAKALAFTPANAALASDLVKIKGRKGKPLKADLDVIADRRTKCLARCTELLAPAAAAYAKADCSDELATLVATMRVNSMPIDGIVAKLDLVVFEPYLDWRTKAAVAKLDAGWEYADGAWADPKKVEAMNEAHATWTNPWVFADEVHEVRTNLPRRMAKQVAAHVFAYRNFFLGYFTGEWNLVQPAVKLPVIVTRTRAEMEERVRTIPDAPPAPPGAAAFYLQGGEKGGNPCFASIETHSESGESVVFDFDLLQQTFEHELGHQIAFEYSRRAASESDAGSAGFLWVTEGVADFLPNYDLVDGEWKLVMRPWLGLGETKMEAAFAWCHEHVDQIPKLSQFVATPDERFGTSQNYHVAAALAGFLLEGKDREYRQEFVALAQAVHSGRADAAALSACFPGDTLATIDSEFREFCAGLQIVSMPEPETDPEPEPKDK